MAARRRERAEQADRRPRRGKGSRPPRDSASAPRRDGGSSSETLRGSERLEGPHSILEALRAGRRRIHRLVVSDRSAAARAPSRELREILEAAEAAGVPISVVPQADLKGARVAGAARTAPLGVALDVGPLPELDLAALLDSVLSRPQDGGREPERGIRLVVLDGIEDPQNLGAIARVAEASGAAGLLLARRRQAPLSAAASRASAGALEWLPVARVANLRRAMDALKERGFWLLAADHEARESLFDLGDRAVSGNLAVVLGAEGSGLRAGTLAAVDYSVRIPLRGRVGSLNVATAGAVVLFELMRRVDPPQ